MISGFEIIDVDPSNVEKEGFFCYMSKRTSPGYQQKLAWLKARFAEGMKLRILHETGGRNVGYIEYIPAEYAWRAVNAPGYMVIHCLWVVGKGKGKGYGSHLIQLCLEDARAQGKHGVVMVASDGTWLAKKDVFLKNGFEVVEKAPPSFDLLAYRFDDDPTPAFPTDWEARQARFGDGMSIIRTPQCPYIENAVAEVQRIAAEDGIQTNVVEMLSAAEVQATSPSPYGTFGIVLDGKLFSYHYLSRRDWDKLMKKD